MLESLFPNGFILIGIFAFLLFIIGVISGKMLDTTGVPGSVTAGRLVSVILTGILLSFLFYHLVWGMLCRQYSC